MNLSKDFWPVQVPGSRSRLDVISPCSTVCSGSQPKAVGGCASPAAWEWAAEARG